MDPLDDYNNLYFEGAWEFVKIAPCPKKRRMKGPSGEVKYDHTISDEEEVFFIQVQICKLKNNLQLITVWKVNF